jgi:hypothetical protein
MAFIETEKKYMYCKVWCLSNRVLSWRHEYGDLIVKMIDDVSMYADEVIS